MQPKQLTWRVGLSQHESERVQVVDVLEWYGSHSHSIHQRAQLLEVFVFFRQLFATLLV